MSVLKATTALEIVQDEKVCNRISEVLGDAKVPSAQVYLKSEADAVIAELKADNERLERELEHVKNGDCINTCDVVEKYVQKLHDAEIALRVKSEDCVLLDERIKRFERMRRQTLRELWLARAERAKDKQAYYTHIRGDGWVHLVDKWINVERLCLAKADTFKEDV